MYKPLADSTLMNMTKKEIIEHLRVAEHNHRVCEETIEQQAKNFVILEEKARADERLKVVLKLAESEDTILSDKQYYTLVQLKEQTDCV